MNTEAMFVMMVVFGYAGVVFLGAAVILAVGTFIAACLGQRGMAHGNSMMDKAKYAIQSVFG